MRARVLVVEDEPALRQLLSEELSDDDLDVTAVAGAEPALEHLESEPVDLVISDLRLPGMDGIELLRQTRARSARPAFIVVTAFGTIDQAVRCLKEGADDFLTKPLDLDHLSVRVARVLENRRLRSEVEFYREALDEPDFHGLIGRSPVMRGLFDELRQVGRGRGPVLLHGESGVGKELAARAIHEESTRAEGPFLAVNCAGIPESLLESEFFGHVTGAFTGATDTRAGLFQEAQGGTLLLDEIGEMPVELQAKLLRVLEEGVVRPVGSDQTVPTDVRVVAATNRDLVDEEERMRRDLFYRLETFRVHVPPLREREGDVALLAESFIRRHAARLRRQAPEMSADFLTHLRGYRFPGNVRELENVVERAVTFCGGNVLRAEHLPERMRATVRARAHDGDPADGRPEAAGVDDLAEPDATAAASPDLLAGDVLPSLRELGNRYTRYVLTRVGGNKRRAAALLGISRRTLYRRLDGDDGAPRS
jgi:DNA-binding NtrC family response regulator